MYFWREPTEEVPPRPPAQADKGSSARPPLTDGGTERAAIIAGAGILVHGIGEGLRIRRRQSVIGTNVSDVTACTGQLAHGGACAGL